MKCNPIEVLKAGNSLVPDFLMKNALNINRLVKASGY
jgi:hypothetical protein